MKIEHTPPSYQDIFNSMSDEDFLKYINNSVFNKQFPKTKISDRKIISEKLLDQLNLSKNIISLTNKVIKKHQEAIQEFLIKNGIRKDKIQSPWIEDLNYNGLLFPWDVNGEPYLVMPLEACFSLPIKEVYSIHSLMGFLKYLKNPGIKNIALANEIEVENKSELSLNVELYLTLLKNVKENYSSLSPFQIEILKIIQNFISYNNCISAKDLYTRLNTIYSKYIKRFKKRGKGEYGFLNHFVSHNEDWGIESIIFFNEMDKDLLGLISKGFLGFREYSRYFSNEIEYFIPDEVQKFLEEQFDIELIQKRKELEKTLYTTKEPDKILESPSGRILDDILKLQIVLSCKMLELTQKREIKKKNLSIVTKLLNITEEYLINLLRIIPHNIKSNYIILEHAVDYDLMKLMKKSFSHNPLFRQMLIIVFELKGWVSIDKVIPYLLLDKEIVKLNASRSNLHHVFQEFVFGGLIDLSEDRKVLRPSSLLKKIISDPSSMPVVKGDARPIMIQPNLELLIPFNSEINLIETLYQFSEITSLDKMIHFKLTKNTLLNCFDLGWTVKKLKDFLIEYSSTGIPKPVEIFINGIGNKQGEAIIIPSSALIQCSGPEIKEKILSLKEINCKPLKGNDNILIVTGKKSIDTISFLKSKGIFAEHENARISNSAIKDRLRNYFDNKYKGKLIIVYRNGKNLEITNPCYIYSLSDHYVEVTTKDRHNYETQLKIELHDIVIIEEA